MSGKPGWKQEVPEVAFADGQVNDFAVLRCATALRVTPPARCGSESNMAGRSPSSPAPRSITDCFTAPVS